MDHHDSIEPKTFVVIELSKRSWVIGVATPDRDKPSIYRLTGGDTLGLLARLRRTSDAKDMVLCFEAGHDGFWLARFLQAEGYGVRVLDPASLQVNRRARRVKTDRIDALAMLRALAAIYRGERQVCAQVRVLTVEEEDARRSHRILAREVFARSFASRRHLASYLGLTPSAYDSGTVTKCQGISKAGNSWARRILIEIAWLWLKYQPHTTLAR